MKAYLYSLILIFLGLMSACEDSGEEMPAIIPGEQIVIQSLMTDKPGRQEVSISRLMALPGDTGAAVRGARVFLSNSDTVVVLKEDSLRPGIYFFVGATEMRKKHTLQVIYGQQVYSASAQGEPGMVFNPPVFEKNATDGLWYPVYVAPPYMPDHPAMYELMADWSMMPAYTSLPPDQCRARMLFFTLPSIDVTQLLPPPSLSRGFPEGAIVNIRRYAMDMSYAAYWREVLLETRWAAGLFALEPTRVPSNFSNGALGWFAICGVTELSLVLGK